MAADTTRLPTISAVHVRHAAHKATTRRDERAASLRRTGRRRASAGKAARRSVVLPYRRDMPACGASSLTSSKMSASRASPSSRTRRAVMLSSGVSRFHGSCPRAPSAAGRTRSSSTPCWPQQPSMAGPNRTCLMRSRGGRPTTSGSTRCSRRSPTSAPPPAGRARRCGRHARTYASALAIQRHNDQFGTQPKRSS